MKQGLEASKASSANSGSDDADGRDGRLTMAGSRRVSANEVRCCEECNCVLAGPRADNRRTKYCFDCSEVVKRRQSAEWKRDLRATIGSAEYQAMYDPYPTAEEKRAYHREYQQRWRARNKNTL